MKTPTEVADMCIGEDSVDFLLSLTHDDNPETSSDTLFPVLVIQKLLPEQVDRVFISFMDNNSPTMFYLVVLALERYRNLCTYERIETYVEVCYDEKKNKLCKYFKKYLSQPCRICRELPMFCKCYCVHCFLFMKECNCDGDFPIMMGEDLDKI